MTITLGPAQVSPPTATVRLWWCRTGRGLSWWTTDQAEARDADEAVEYGATRLVAPQEELPL